MEMPGCCLCMGNQAQVKEGATVFSTCTRNFPNRLGKNSNVYLGSAELAAICSKLGRIPTKEEYMVDMGVLTAASDNGLPVPELRPDRGVQGRGRQGRGLIVRARKKRPQGRFFRWPGLRRPWARAMARRADCCQALQAHRPWTLCLAAGLRQELRRGAARVAARGCPTGNRVGATGEDSATGGRGAATTAGVETTRRSHDRPLRDHVACRSRRPPGCKDHTRRSCA